MSALSHLNPITHRLAVVSVNEGPCYGTAWGDLDHSDLKHTQLETTLHSVVGSLGVSALAGSR